MNGLTQKVSESGWWAVAGGMFYATMRVILRAIFPPGYYFRFMRRFLVPVEEKEEAES